MDAHQFPSDLCFSTAVFASYRSKLGAIFLLSVFTNTFGVYIVLRHSPAEMRTYRWFLLNIIIWAFIVDVFLSVLFQPYPLLPIYGLCSLGLSGMSQSNFWGVYLVLTIFLEVACSCCAAIILALCYRIAILLGADSKLARWASSLWGIVLFCLITCCFYAIVAAICLLTILQIEDQQAELRQEIYQNFPGLRTVLDSNLCIFTRMNALYMALTFAVIFLFVCTFLYILMISVSIFILFRRRHRLSANTFRMHRNFIISLLLQIAVPYASVFIPISVPIFCIYYGFEYPRSLDDSLAIVCSFHSTLNVLVMVLSCRPYREAIRQSPVGRLLANSLRSHWSKGRNTTVPGKVGPTKEAQTITFGTRTLCRQTPN